MSKNTTDFSPEKQKKKNSIIMYDSELVMQRILRINEQIDSQLTLRVVMKRHLLY